MQKCPDCGFWFSSSETICPQCKWTAGWHLAPIGRGFGSVFSEMDVKLSAIYAVHVVNSPDVIWR